MTNEEDYSLPQSEDAKVPQWLKFVYVFMVIFGLFWLFMNWNGPWKYLDPGHWRALEKAANTTFNS